jgi:AraC-like DNA-binding protein
MDTDTLISVIALQGDAKFAWSEVDARLAGKVDVYWSLTVETPSVELRIVPDGRVDLIFDLLKRRAFLAGPNERPFDVKHDRATRLLGARMSPDFIAATLGAQPLSRRGGWSPLKASLGAFAVELIERIASAPSVPAQVATLETFLLARVGVADLRVSRALAEIRRSAGSVGVAALGRRSGASPRNLARLFDHWVGMAPKTFARIARVQEALRCMQETPAPNLKALAAELGFADQAHMSREVKAMTGASPGRMAEIFKSPAEIFKLGGG